jgi:hypothetical protein
MNVYGSSDEHQPVAWLRGYPLYVAHLIVAGYVLSMIVTGVMMAANSAHHLAWLNFSSEAVLRGEVWRVLTYGLVNPPSLWFAIDMLMIVWFGRELEKFFGRRIFLWFFATLYLVAPVVLLLLGLWQPTGLSGERGAFAFFVAFATLYPNAVMLFSLLAKWVALILVGLQSLIFLSQRQHVALITLWASAGYAFAFVRFQQGVITLPRFRFRFPRAKPKLRVLPDLPVGKTAASRPAADDSMAEIDALLDKIATSGIASLTPKERARLDAARDDLLRKTSSRR